MHTSLGSGFEPPKCENFIFFEKNAKNYKAGHGKNLVRLWVCVFRDISKMGVKAAIFQKFFFYTAF